MARHTYPQQKWQDRSSSRSVLLTILGEYVFPQGQPVWTRTFVEALAALGFGTPTARQALARSGAAGWLVSQRQGRETSWSLTRQMRDILAAGTERIYGFGCGTTPWSGEWLLLQVSAPESNRKLQTRLQWAGFGFLGSGLWISHDPSRENEAAKILEDLDAARKATSFRAAPGSIGGTEDLVRRAWDLERIAEHHRRFLSEMDGSLAKPPKESFVALTRLVHRWRSLPLVDPDLPDELLPPRWIGRRAAGRFHELHESWSEAARAWWSSASSAEL